MVFDFTQEAGKRKVPVVEDKVLKRSMETFVAN